KNLLKRIITEKRIEGAHTITIEDIPDGIRDGEGKKSYSLRSTLESYEKTLIMDALRKNG
ncbi:MAG: hypothetical protein DRP08_01805, partial [Candidatus Aenigmatarchaeota archaeon]